MPQEFPELRACHVCPHSCGADRYQGTGFCSAGAELRINLAQLHHGEEPVLSGNKGSGTVFFSYCNLRCIFCQNHEISHLGWGTEISISQFIEILFDLEEAGAHNINLVSPTHFTPQVRFALAEARKHGLRIPIVWNSNGYELVEVLATLEGLVDIYLPDIKYASGLYSRKYSQAPNYPVIALKALVEMYRQVGQLQTDEGGIARRGLLVRHLVLPNRLAGTREVLYNLREMFGTDLALSLMSQYYPTNQAMNHTALARGISQAEYQEALDIAEDMGFERVCIQDLGSDADWTPEFHPEGSIYNEAKLHFKGKLNHA